MGMDMVVIDFMLGECSICIIDPTYIHIIINCIIIYYIITYFE